MASEERARRNANLEDIARKAELPSVDVTGRTGSAPTVDLNAF
jgi:hypothetical protein